MPLGRRRHAQTVVAQPATVPPPIGARTNFLAAVSDLCRPAAWEALSEADRTALLAPYAAVFAAPPAGAEATAGSEAGAQGWIADLAAIWLQRKAARIIQDWLESPVPDVHLVVTGEHGHGRMSLVTTLARRAMASKPAPPDYCYVPNPDDLTRSLLLTLPPHTADPFAFLAEAGRQQVLTDWAKLRAERAETSEDATGPSLAGYFAPALEVAPTLAHAVLERLRAALEAKVGSLLAPPMADIDAPVAHLRGRGEGVTAESEGQSVGASGRGAPVVICLRAPQEPVRLILHANGGVLIVAADVLLEREQASSLWLALRSVLRTGAIFWRGPASPPIPVALRIAVVGTNEQYYDLRRRAEDFSRFFRCRAPFEDDVPWTEAGDAAYQAEAAYAALAAGVARRHGLPPLDPSGVARLVEEGARRVTARQRSCVVANLVTLHDLVVEAGQLARARAGGTHDAALAASGMDVETVLQRRREQHSSLARKLREQVMTGREIVPTAGTAIGQINGLSVYSPQPFEGRVGIPFRISVTVSPGRERLVDIGREAEAVDSSHVSGALTMAGYLTHRYGSQRPISVVARLRFEQDEGSRGNSASAAALFALLSALAEVPIYSARAITGAVGQYGELQIIGAPSEKIEGFWAICRQRRAAGEVPEVPYGVLIPAANAQDLMLRRQVARAIAEEGWFFVWPVATVDEAIPLLTGLPAAEFHARADRRLQRFYELAMPPSGGR